MNKFLTGCFLLFIASSLSAQNTEIKDLETFNPEFKIFQLPGGPLSNSIQGIVQDSVGYMWFASQGGLHRYDGRNFTTYNSEPNDPNTLNSDYVEDIFLDSKGIIWLTHWSGGGLTSYDPDQDQFKRYIYDPQDPESIMPGETGSITEDTDGYIWVGGRRGVSRLDRETGKFKRFQSDPDDIHTLSNNEVRGLYIDKEGTFWVATGMPWTEDTLGGLNRYDPDKESFERFLHDPANPGSITNNKVRAMYEDSRGNFWVGTAGDGLHLMDRRSGTFTHYPYDPENPNKFSRPYLKDQDISNTPYYSHITSIYEDRSGRIWVTAIEGGINVLDPKIGSVKHFEMGSGQNNLNNNFIWQTFQSDDGTIWIATGGEGQQVYKIREQQFKFPFFETKNLNHDTTSAGRGILKDPNGIIWIGNTQNAFTSNVKSSLWRLNRDLAEMNRVPLQTSDSLGILSAFLGSLSMDSTGKLWVGTETGYFTSSIEKPNFKLFRPDLVNTNNFGIPPIMQSSTGQIWIPYWNYGVIRYDPGTGMLELFEHDPKDPKSLAGSIIWSIYEDNAGEIWIGGGTPWSNPDVPLFLDRFNAVTNTFEHFITEYIGQGMVSDMTQDPSGNIWFIDFFEGLYKLDPRTRQLRRFTPFNSLLPSGPLQSIVQYPGGNIWISNEYSLIELDPVSETMSIYDELHGIKSAVDYSNAGSLTADGELLFLRRGGIHAFYPDAFLKEIKTNLPDLRITGFRLLDDNIITGNSDFKEGVLTEPIWETKVIELESDENIFSFSVACFDFYAPESNQIQFMLEGFDRGWRNDLRDGETPSYINISPGEYTFRLRGANSLGVWNKEGISLKIIINPPWWMTWWAFTMYGIVFIAGIFVVDKVQRKRLIEIERARTREKELEQAREIEKAYEELKTTQAQLIQSEKMASLGELTAGIAHEIQNPLNFVNNFSDVNSELIEELKEEIDKGNTIEAKTIANDIAENEKKIVHHGKRAEEIVKSMLQHSRGSEGKKEPTDVNTLADEYLRLAYHGMRAKDKSFNVTMETNFDEQLGKIELVPQDMGRVILNLITNAFFALSEKRSKNLSDYEPTITVSTKKLKDWVEIRIKDNGAGIPRDILNKIFQPFFSTKGTGKGTGLGLSLSYDIITKGHGGSIDVESREGEGTEFKILLPDK